MGMLLVSFGVSFAAYIVLGALINHRKLRQFKGPPLAGFTEFWLFWKSWTARLNIAEYEAIQRYGTLTTICNLSHASSSLKLSTWRNNWSAK
jgi:ABC-type transporter lipoprotein component MlaA